MLSFLIYTQCMILTVVYCVFALPFLIVWNLRNIFHLERTAPLIRFMIFWYGKSIVHIGCFPWVHVRFTDLVPEEACPKGIYIFNHRSASDPFLVSCVFKTPAAIQAVNRWPMRLFFFGHFARRAGYMDVLSMSYDDVLEHCRKMLDSGISIAVFPEGTRSGSSQINSFHGLFFRIAADLKVPLIPVAITGNEKIPDRSFRMHRGTIQIHKLPQIPLETVCGMKPYPLKTKVRAILLEETARMESL